MMRLFTIRSGDFYVSREQNMHHHLNPSPVLHRMSQHYRHEGLTADTRELVYFWSINNTVTLLVTVS